MISDLSFVSYQEIYVQFEKSLFLNLISLEKYLEFICTKKTKGSQ